MRAGATNRRLMALACACVALSAAFGAGAASAREPFKASLTLTSHRPGSASGGELHLVWPDNGPGGKPKPEATGIFQLPPGTRINEFAVPTCTASDTQLQAEGDAACPGGSYVGPGHATVITGLGPPLDPFRLDDRWYHSPRGIVGLFRAHGSPGPVIKVNRVEIRGATFIARLSLPPGYPPGTKTAPKTTDQIIQNRVGRNGAFITTPPRCPRSGKWIARATTIYDDGTSDTATSATKCKRRDHDADRP